MIKKTSLPLLLSLILLSLPKPSLQQPFPSNPRLLKAFTALQAWKHAITNDPRNVTSNWYGFDVCSYTGVFCSPAPDDPNITTVAGIDLNHAGISGSLPCDLGLLSDLALFHLNSNQFTGTIPDTFRNMTILHELDVSNNQLSGAFPSVVLSIPALKYLDIRFNRFWGNLPSTLFDLKLDALFVNSNFFQQTLPTNFGNSTVSVFVMANNNIGGCLPPGIGNMAGTLNEIILMNVGLGACLPDEIGLLNKLTVFDVSFNGIGGSLPESMGNMTRLERLNVAHNKLSGSIPESICKLPRLQNFTYSYNYFCAEPSSCRKVAARNDTENCIPYRRNQRSEQECRNFYSTPRVDCSSFGCLPPPPSPPPPPPPSPPPPSPPPPPPPSPPPPPPPSPPPPSPPPPTQFHL